MRFSFLNLLLFLFTFCNAQSDWDSIRNRPISSAQMRKDFHDFRKVLEQAHPGLYRYQTRKEVTNKFDTCFQLLEKDVTLGDFYLMLGDIVSNIRCAHTTVTPAGNFMSLFDESPLFPYRLRLFENRLYVLFNCTNDPTVKPGFEVVSVNGLTASQFVDKVIHLMPADGYNRTAKTYLLGQPIFFMYAALAIGQPKVYQFVLKDLQGNRFERLEQAVPSKLVGKRVKSNPANRRLLKMYQRLDKLESVKKWRLEIDEKDKLARIVFRTFSNGRDNEDAKKRMNEFMSSSLQRVRDLGIQDLIIDIRWNAGGYDAQALELYTWLIDSASYYYKSMHAVTLDTLLLSKSSISKSELQHAVKIIQKDTNGNYPIPEFMNHSLALHQPKPDGYSGRLYFLVAGSTGSAAAEFAAMAKAHGLGFL